LDEWRPVLGECVRCWCQESLAEFVLTEQPAYRRSTGTSLRRNTHAYRLAAGNDMTLRFYLSLRQSLAAGSIAAALVDQALVRHIYDTYCMVGSNTAFVDRAAAHFRDCVENDRGEFRHHTAFVEDPKQSMAAALALAETEERTKREYEQVLLPLVYGTTRPTFGEAFAVFKSTALRLLATL
jgi:hypothetical protein